MDTNNLSLVELIDDIYFFKCPHCNNYIAVEKNQVNCGIFRHAVYKNDNNPIDPHATKNICDELVKTDKVYGCAKPFKLVIMNDGTNYVTSCDYI
jgi:hypothetical protein